MQPTITTTSIDDDMVVATWLSLRGCRRCRGCRRLSQHTITVQEHISELKPNKILNTVAAEVSRSELSLPRKTRTILAQLRTNKSSFLSSYLNHIDSTKYPSPLPCLQYSTSRHRPSLQLPCTSHPPHNQRPMDKPC